MVSRSVYDIIHFYYCLSVSIKIHRKYDKGLTYIHINIFILKWLEQARKNKHFQKNVQSEIDWLSEHIRSQGPLFMYSERLIDGIYNTCVKMMREKKL